MQAAGSQMRKKDLEKSGGSHHVVRKIPILLQFEEMVAVNSGHARMRACTCPDSISQDFCRAPATFLFSTSDELSVFSPTRQYSRYFLFIVQLVTATGK